MIYFCKPTARGVGTSTVARVLIERIVAQGRRVYVADCTETATTAHRFLGLPLACAKRADLTTDAGRTAFVEAMAAGRKRFGAFDAVVDMSIEAGEGCDGAHEVLTSRLQAAGHDSRVIHVIGPDIPSAHVLRLSLTTGMAAYTPSPDHNLLLLATWLCEAGADFDWDARPERQWSESWGVPSAAAPTVRIAELAAALDVGPDGEIGRELAESQSFAAIASSLSPFSQAYFARWQAEFGRILSRIMPAYAVQQSSNGAA